MLFNSIEFLFFLPIVFALYWLLNKGSLRIQNLFIVCASYFFYGWWDWRFLSLIFISSCIDFSIGILLGKNLENHQRKWLLWCSLLVNISLLGVFKYYNFFVESFAEAFSFFGNKTYDPIILNILLPVGISFYTFQTLSYSIDVYRRKLVPTKDAIAFFAFVSFFPQLVAGPIERATNLLPQFLRKRQFDYQQGVDGMRQMLWGFFLKLVVADNCAIYVNDIFNNYETYPGGVLLMGAVLFAFQIYGDFSGYSNIAIGTARLFGFNLMQNFAFPYFSRDIAEFWRRWHISLSTWFRDYLYIPLGGSRGGNTMRIRNVFIIFLVSGFWHGANWTFIIWGFLNACYFLPLLLGHRNRQHLDVVAQNRLLPSGKELVQIAITFFLVVIAWIFFRAENITHALAYIKRIFSFSLFDFSYDYYHNYFHFYGIALLLVVEWLGRHKQHALYFEVQQDQNLRSKMFRWGGYIFLIFSVFYGGNFTNETFIYFQF